MPLYVGDYLRDTPHLTTEQHGAYLLLLFACWTMAKLPNDDGKLMAITRCESMAKWLNLRKSLEPFFKVSTEFWEQKRVKKEQKKIALTHKLRSAAGQKGASTRWQHKTKTKNSPAYGPAYGKTMARARVPEPYPEPEVLPPQPPLVNEGGRRARGLKKSPRTVQMEAFAYAAAQRAARTSDC